MTVIFWLRSEVKLGERRTPLSPVGAKSLIDGGAKIFVERCPHRLFDEQAYLDVGCELVANNSWYQAPKEAFILGLKELELKDFPIIHRHIYFAHAFKGQDEAAQILSRFKAGGGEILDLEFLQDNTGRRVCAFGFWAGYVGAAMSVAGYYHYAKSSASFPAQVSYDNKEAYLAKLRSDMLSAGQEPKALVIGANGRSGKGVVALFSDLGIEVTQWGRAETQAGGPFTAINDFDIMVNCAYLAPGTLPFVTKQSLGVAPNISIISDVSCDPNSSGNPIPIYSAITKLPQPIIESEVAGVYIQAVDHLPTVLPKESSEDFSEQLLPYLQELAQGTAETGVWKKAQDYYQRAIS
ncbi:MAG: saccharopine dehydrogenase [Psychrobium sp.]|nr:saccharopine dehydrogenase [Psychrobium sp.]